MESIENTEKKINDNQGEVLISKKIAATEVLIINSKIKNCGIISLAGLFITLLLTQLSNIAGTVAAVILAIIIGLYLNGANKKAKYLESTYNIKGQGFNLRF